MYGKNGLYCCCFESGDKYASFSEVAIIRGRAFHHKTEAEFKSCKRVAFVISIFNSCIKLFAHSISFNSAIPIAQTTNIKVTADIVNDKKNSQALMTGDFQAEKKLKVFFLLRNLIRIRMVQKPMFLICSIQAVVITLGPTKKNRTTSSMHRNSALSRATICGNIKMMSIPIAGLLVT